MNPQDRRQNGHEGFEVGEAFSLSPSAGERGNEAPPTRTAGRILQAQLDRLPDSERTITSIGKPVDGGSARVARVANPRLLLSGDQFPSPRPSPAGRGRIARR